MKALLIFGSICLSLYTFGQSQMTMPPYPTYHDLPGTTFLVAYQENTYTHIAEVNASGSFLWEDSINFQSGPGNINILAINNFPGSDEFVVISTRKIAFGLDDSVAVQFNKFSLSSQQFTLSTNDTLLSRKLLTVSYKDTSIYLFNQKDAISGPTANQSETYSLNSNLELSLISPIQALSGDLYFITSFYVINDTINMLFNGGSYNYKKWYDKDMNMLDSSMYSIPNTQNFDWTFYREPVGPDSTLLLYQGWSSGTPDPDWRFTWTDDRLNLLSYSEFSPPWEQFPSFSDSLPYSAGPFDKALVHNQLIYVLGQVDIGVLVNKIFVYDFDFNLYCEIPVSVGVPQNDRLLKLVNNRPYYIDRSAGQDELYEINTCNFTTGLSPVTEDPAFEIYPNPASDVLHISNPTGELLDVILMDCNGRVMEQWSSNSTDKQIDVSTYQEGMYLIQLRYRDKAYTEKVIMHR